MGLKGFFKGLGKTALGAGAGFLTGGPAGALIGGGTALAGALNKPQQNVTATTTDPKTQAYQDAMRQQAMNASNVALQGPGGASGASPGGPAGNSWFTGPQSISIGDQASQFMNPYMSNVIDPLKAEYDRLRQGAVSQTGSQATLANAYGGSRAALLTGNRLGQLDRGQASDIGNLLNSGYNSALSMGTQYAEHQRQLSEQQLQEPLFRQQQAQGFLGNGLAGPVGQTTTQQQTGNGVNDFLQNAVGAYNIYQGVRGGGNSAGSLTGFTPPANTNLGMNRFQTLPSSQSYLGGRIPSMQRR